jgi:pyrophosphatase PpaX
MRFSTVLFDLDGTLVDSIELIIRSAEHAFASRPGPRPSRDEIKSGIGRPLLAQFRQLAGTEAELDGYVVAYREYQLEHHDALTTAYPGIDRVVGRLHAAGCSLGVVTSKIEPLALRALVHVGLDRAFRVVVGLESTARHKPDPDPLLFALDRLGSRPGDSAYVGDTPFDIQSARAAGVTSIAVTWGACDEETLTAERPDSLVRTSAELATELGLRSTGAPAAHLS